MPMATSEEGPIAADAFWWKSLLRDSFA